MEESKIQLNTKIIIIRRALIICGPLQEQLVKYTHFSKSCDSKRKQNKAKKSKAKQS